MSFNSPVSVVLRELRNRRFRKIGQSLGFSNYAVDRMIERGMTARVISFGTEQVNVQIVDDWVSEDEPREYVAPCLADAKFFVEEWNRRSQILHTEGGEG